MSGNKMVQRLSVKSKIVFTFVLCLTLSTPCISQRRILDSLMQVLKKNVPDTVLVSTHLMVGQMWMKAAPDSMIAHDKKAVLICDENLKTENVKEKKRFEYFKGTALHHLAYIYRSLGDNKRSIEYSNQSIIYQEACGDMDGIAKNYNNMGNVYKEQGDMNKAMELYMKSLHLREEIKDEIGLSSSFHNVANMYKDKGDIKSSLEFYEKACASERDSVIKWELPWFWVTQLTSIYLRATPRTRLKIVLKD
jgi:tetratricopeptide (TPR) repeat protein